MGRGKEWEREREKEGEREWEGEGERKWEGEREEEMEWEGERGWEGKREWEGKRNGKGKGWEGERKDELEGKGVGRGEVWEGERNRKGRGVGRGKGKGKGPCEWTSPVTGSWGRPLRAEPRLPVTLWKETPELSMKRPFCFCFFLISHLVDATHPRISPCETEWGAHTLVGSNSLLCLLPKIFDVHGVAPRTLVAAGERFWGGPEGRRCCGNGGQAMKRDFGLAAAAGTELVLATSGDEKHPPENIVDG